MSAHRHHGAAGYEDLVGLVSGFCMPPFTGLRAPGEPSMGYLSIPDTSMRALGVPAMFNGRGYDRDPQRLRAAVLCEAFERYSLMDIDDLRTRYASLAELERDGTPHVSPARMLSLPPGVTRMGVEDEIPPATKPIQWIDAADLSTGDRVLLPARYCILFGDDASNRAHDEGHWYCANSNGAATATSPAAACLSGLFELLERDAFMLLWYHQLQFPFLTLDPSSRIGGRLAAALSGCRLDYRLIDLTEIHGVPTVVAVVRGDQGGDLQYGLGAGTAHTVTEAAWRAAKEALAYYALQRRSLLAGGLRKMQPEDVRIFVDRPVYYLDSEHQSEFEFLFAERPVRAASATTPDWLEGTPAAVLRRLVGRMKQREIDLYAFELTPSDGTGLGLFTYRVVSPQLVPLDVDHQARHLHHERLRTEPTRRGWRPDQPELEQLNHAPHPFP